ncbi:hypothetical protein Tco_0622213 [Tanacetum coccineum]
MTITRSSMTPEAIEELVNRRVEEALAAHEATHAANFLETKNQSQNGSDGDNRNGGNGNGGNENGRNKNQMRMVVSPKSPCGLLRHSVLSLPLHPSSLCLISLVGQLYAQLSHILAASLAITLQDALSPQRQSSPHPSRSLAILPQSFCESAPALSVARPAVSRQLPSLEPFSPSSSSLAPLPRTYY